jgi:enamine deaminase RidA (YjgF/YER057c/UK114 family)
VTKIHNPTALGTPAAYSHGIEVPSSARTLYIAGQIGMKDGKVVAGGIAGQTRQAFENLEAILAAAGMKLSNIVKTTVFLTDPANYGEFGKVRTEMLGATKPASTLVYISGLVMPELLVEVEAIAVAE